MYSELQPALNVLHVKYDKAVVIVLSKGFVLPVLHEQISVGNEAGERVNILSV